MLPLVMSTVVNIDGRLVSQDEAYISVFDRGFLYGDSIYEVIRTYGGEPFELRAHLERLETEVRRTIGAADNVAEGRETYVRVVVSRGAGEIGLDPALAEHPRTVIMARPLTAPPLEAYRHGVEVAIVGVQRVAQAAVDPAAKTGNYLNNLLALKEARDRGAYEAVMLDSQGRITEGSTSNLFVVRQGTLVTTPRDVGILEGVTRRTVLWLAAEAGIASQEKHLGPADLRGAEEAFITSTIREVLPVTRCDGQPIGDGRVGGLTRRIQSEFRRCTGTPVDGGGF